MTEPAPVAVWGLTWWRRFGDPEPTVKAAPVTAGDAVRHIVASLPTPGMPGVAPCPMTGIAHELTWDSWVLLDPVTGRVWALPEALFLAHYEPVARFA